MNAPERVPFAGSRAVAGELACIVRVNEEIKAVVATATRINLMALNAIFLAKRAGNAALGFGVLSNELRRFAQDLTRHMAVLRDMTSGSVGSVTGVVQHQRNSRILSEAIRLSGEGVPGVDMARRRCNQRLARELASLRGLDQRLRAAVEETQQLVELGGVLARSAKIEAAYGGGFSPALMQVSTDFADVIAQIKRSLENLSKERLVKD
ncbi:MAG TPA: chemotaxis protein [Zoogloea sp.]|uniref:chemotaxis protein n=1 Tax=Zoogloea sp. TaxID=49181 RepID=UPI002C803C21|nr:chemotaxis protein [Zoogloea sp.]HMV16525.1 chemotaxis protein [Rhodocyclaceae bacterium]HMV63606.1 chemotaxis protein [Rhodocyclaceae bacterium]HMW50621.1 chemotaxis protein [Rhodocyclaceae bacterium]HMY48790.1 chemotaxis protein [Rhodocyclaceae bacterium]HMZ75009.1 chemotaxis protein [Rhodocyclaceae bacterium]